MSYYTGGTISLIANGTAVAGTATAFASQVKAGDTLVLGGVPGVVDSVESNTAFTLAQPWAGATATDEADYLVLHTGSGWQSLVTLNQTLAEIVRRLEAGQGLKPDATGTLAERDDHDDEAQGFIYVRTDSDPFEIYIKASATSGDWAGPSTFGQGDAGTDGATLEEVLAALGVHSITISADDPSGGVDGDLWFKVVP